MKKLFALLLCLCLTLPLAAMGEETVELRFWIRTGDSFVKDYVDQYIQEHPNVHVTIEEAGSGYGDLRTKFNLGLTSGDLPDLSIAGFSGMGTLYDAGAIIDVAKADKAGALDDIVETFSTRCLYNDAVIAVPYQVSCPVMYYNKDLLAKTSDAVPETFTQLMATAEKAVEKDENGNTTVYGFNTAADINWYLCAMIYDFGGSFFDEEGNVKLNTETTQNMFAWWAEMAKKGILPANQHQTAEDDFCNGSTLFYCTSCASYGAIKEAVGDKFELGVAYFPGEVTQQVNQGGNGIVVFTKDEKKQEAALDLIKYLLAPEHMEVIVDKGFLPVTNAVLNGDYVTKKAEEDPNYGVLYSQVNNISVFIQHPAYSTATGELKNIASELEAYPDSDIMELLDES